MERKASEIEAVEIATPQQVRGMRAIYKQRMRDQVEVLVTAFEKIDPPKDHAGIDRMAKAMVSMNKAIEVIFAEDPEEEESQEEDDMDEERESVRDAVDAWRVILDRKLAGIAERRKAAGLACDGDFDPRALSQEVDRLAALRPGPARG